MRNEKGNALNSGTPIKKTDVAMEEPCEAILSNDGSCNRVTFDELLECHKTLSNRLGLPCEMDIDIITPYPAIPEEYGAQCPGFGGYRVALAPLSRFFCAISFRGVGNGMEVVSGYIVDNQGYVESVAVGPDGDDGYATLPLTPDSHALYASVPLPGGLPLWNNITVKLFPLRKSSDGASDSYASNLYMCINKIVQDYDNSEPNDDSKKKDC